ncbi:tail Fiber protein [Pseudomonas phage phiDCL-PA6]|nr:tail Fiber protein [Pseudomonas phage phiDCL-PA6]
MITPELIPSPFAAQGDKDPIPQTSSTGFANLRDGYTPDYEISLASNNPQAKAVERKIQNQLFFIATQNAQAWQRQMAPPWFQGMPGGYERNAEVVRVGNDGIMRRYRSMVNANASDPLSSTTWEEQPAWSVMRTNIPMPAGGPGLSSGGEVITTGRNFNELLNGTWEFFSDAIVVASQNAPVYPASAGAAAGMLEAKSWVSGANTFCVQRYTDRVGNVAVRGLNAGAWTNWMYAVNVMALQQGRVTYGVAAGSANAYTLTLVPQLQGGLVDGMILRVKFNTMNTGASTINVSGLGAKAIVGAANFPLTGGELGQGLIAELVFDAAGDRWRILAGAPRIQVGNADQDYQAPSWKQVKDYVASQKLTEVDWADVVNKPNVAIQDTTPWFANLELSDARPFIDFHFNNNRAKDFDYRFISEADGSMAFYSRQGSAGPTQDILFSRSNVTFLQPRLDVAKNLAYIANSGPLWQNTTADQPGWKFTFAQGVDANNNAVIAVNTTNPDGSYRSQVMRWDWASTNVIFNNRPLFAGQYTPWDSGNFDPSTKLTVNATNQIAGPTGIRNTNGNTGNMNTWGSGSTTASYGNAAIQIFGKGGGEPAAIYFDNSQTGWYLGMDKDGQLKRAGWSLGNNSYVITDESNIRTHINTMAARPIWGNVEFWGPWNFNPNTKLTLGAFNDSQYTRMTNSGAKDVGIASMTSYADAAMSFFNYEVSNPTGPRAAVISFVRNGSRGVLFGLDSDNKLKWGGYSLGAVAFEIADSNNLMSLWSSHAAAPNWNGQTIWRSGNFNPDTKATLAARNTTSSPTIFSYGASGIASTGQVGALVVENNSVTNTAAAITFHSPQKYQVNFGLDADNVVKIGGGTMGGVAYPIIHSGNYNNYINQALVQVGLGGVGSYAILAVFDTSAPAASIAPGTIMDSSKLFYSSCDSTYRSSARPTGTWRCMGYVYNRDSTNGDSASLFQRVT